MVRKRSNPDSETKMPVKTSPKEKAEAQRVSHFILFFSKNGVTDDVYISYEVRYFSVNHTLGLIY